MTETTLHTNGTNNHKENAGMANNNTPAPNAASATGRDGYIMVKALVYAIARIQSLPDDRQEHGDMMDMCELVYESELPEGTLDMILMEVEHSVQHEIDLFPGEGGEGDRRDMRARVDAMKAAQGSALRHFNVENGEAA
ncbi:hypothetical protein [Paracoccus yeei]|uniref:Uncharacterized protein n=1 Tax=Paracoccus yeei TaxID=147645 RepID=A0A5P2QTG7_9RHOB|nr:hypothetical protein [Paracoccus yeei]QEU08696.1 hypothetical protein FOB51_12225 [Paracoccus yeei]